MSAGGDPIGRESIPRSAAFALAMRLVGAAFTGALTLFLVRYLGPEEFGVLAVTLSIAGLLLLPADFGLSRSAARFIAERLGDRSKVAEVFRHTLGLKALGAGIVALVLVGAAGPIADIYGVSDLEWPLRVVAVALFAQSILMLFTVTFEAIGRNALGLRLAASESVVETSTAVGLVLAGAGVTGAVAGRAAGYCFAALLGLFLCMRVIGRADRQAGSGSGMSLRRIAGYAGVLFIVDVAFAAFSQVDILMIGAILDTRSAGLFSAPLQILIFTEYVGLALAAAVAPRLARGEGREPNVAAFQSTLRLLMVFQFVLVPPFVVWATPITELLFGPGYEESADVFRALGPYILLLGPGPLITLAVNYLGEARSRIPLALAAVAINVVIDAILIPEIGIVGGAIGTNVAFTVFIGGHVLICRRVIDLQVLPLAKTTLRALFAATAMAAVLFAFGTGSLSALEAVAGTVLSLLAYAGAILVVREFTRSELRSGLAATRRVLGGLAP